MEFVYCYDRRGNVLSKKQTAGAVVSSVAYTYTLADRVSKIVYPSGGSASFTRNALGQITQIAWKASAGATAQTLVKSASYLPFRNGVRFTYLSTPGFTQLRLFHGAGTNREFQVG